MTQEDHEEAHTFTFVAHNTKEHGQDKSERSEVPTRGGRGRPPGRIGNAPLSFKEYRREHEGCWISYGKNFPHKYDPKTCKIYEEDKKAYFQAHPVKVPEEKRIEAWQGGKVLVDAREDRGMQVTAEFDRWRKQQSC